MFFGIKEAYSPLGLILKIDQNGKGLRKIIPPTKVEQGEIFIFVSIQFRATS